MSLFKQIDVNRLLKITLDFNFSLYGSGFPEDEFPHIFSPKYSITRENDDQTIFFQISEKLLAQWWLSEEHYWLNRDLEKDVKDKIATLIYEVRKITEKQCDKLETLPRVDSGFDTIKSAYIKMAEDEVNDEKTKEFHKLVKYDKEHCTYNSDELVENLPSLFSSVINHFDYGGRKLSFVGLHTTMIEALEDVKKASKKRIEWLRIESEEMKRYLAELSKSKRPPKKAAKYLRLLLEFEKNFKSLNLHRFYEEKGKLHELNKLRNSAMHDQNKNNNGYSKSNLIACYREVKALLETIEDDDDFRKLVLK